MTALHERTEDTASVELRQLAVVADQHQLPLSGLEMFSQARGVARTEHARFVNDEHCSGGQRVSGVEAREQRGNARTRDACLVLELSRGSPSHRRAEDRHAVTAPDLIGDTE